MVLAPNPPEPKGSIGFLHPGAMGATLATVAKGNGFTTCWFAEGRSRLTRDRAMRAAMTEVPNLSALCHQSDTIVSICPPHAALDVARLVAEHDFRGIYIDANAISPLHAQEIDRIIASAGGQFIDAAVVGPPPAQNTDTILYLSGGPRQEIPIYFVCSGLKIIDLGEEVGRASSLKMCHSAMGKSQLAMLLATLAGAESLGVRHELLELWSIRADTASLTRNMSENFRRLGKAWRFVGEMDEVADTFASVGLPGGFHIAASDIFSRLSGLSDHGAEAEVLKLVLDKKPSKDN